MNAANCSEQRSWRPLALVLVIAACLLVIGFRLAPYSVRGVNFVPAGAMLLFAGARLRPASFFLLPFVPLLATDLYFFFVNHLAFPYVSYVGYAVYLAIGWFGLRRTTSPAAIGFLAIAGSVLFFLITNFGVWLDQAINPDIYASEPLTYPPTLRGLLFCYEMALPFYRGTFSSDLLFTGVFFVAHSLLARAYFPLERASQPGRVQAVGLHEES
jgi:hypothetical protein